MCAVTTVTRISMAGWPVFLTTNPFLNNSLFFRFFIRQISVRYRTNIVPVETQFLSGFVTTLSNHCESDPLSPPVGEATQGEHPLTPTMRLVPDQLSSPVRAR